MSDTARCPIRYAAIEPFYKHANGECAQLHIVFIIPLALETTFPSQPIVECTDEQRDEAERYVAQLGMVFPTAEVDQLSVWV